MGEQDVALSELLEILGAYVVRAHRAEQAAGGCPWPRADCTCPLSVCKLKHCECAPAGQA